MCDCNESCACAKSETQAPAKAPLDRLFDATRAAMARHYPEYAADFEKGNYSRVVDIFAADALGEKGLNTLPHRMSDEALAAMLDEHLETLFDGLSDSMITFYKDKLRTARR